MKLVYIVVRRVQYAGGNSYESNDRAFDTEEKANKYIDKELEKEENVGHTFFYNVLNVF